MKIISDWFQRFFNDPQAVILTVVLVLGASVILIMGKDLAPVLASIVIAYLLEGIVQILQRWLRLPRLLATFVVFVLFISFVLFLLFGLLPLTSRQLTQLVQQLPVMVVKGQHLAVIGQQQPVMVALGLALAADYIQFALERAVAGFLY